MANNAVLEDLIRDFKQKDIKAFERIYEMYSQNIHGVIYAIVRNEAIAQEVMQDVFMKAWNNAESYSPKKGRLFTWLLNIARNAAIDVTRSKKFNQSKQNLNSSFFVDILASNDNIEQNIDLKYIKKLMSSLKETCISLLELLYFKGYTQKETSEELGIPLGTVKTNNRKCVSELRSLVLR